MASTKRINIFGDKASIVPREMLKDRKRRWVVRDFSRSNGISVGMAQEVLQQMARKGYADRVTEGPGSYTELGDPEPLIAEWSAKYDFERNRMHTYYSPDPGILRPLFKRLKGFRCALTLHAGANLLTHFVATDEIHVYLKLADWTRELAGIRQDLDLKELVSGGNVHFIEPYYSKSVFRDVRSISGLPVVSNIQLYLDLYNYKPRGREHAEELRRILKEKGKDLD